MQQVFPKRLENMPVFTLKFVSRRFNLSEILKNNAVDTQLVEEAYGI